MEINGIDIGQRFLYCGREIMNFLLNDKRDMVGESDVSLSAFAMHCRNCLSLVKLVSKSVY